MDDRKDLHASTLARPLTGCADLFQLSSKPACHPRISLRSQDVSSWFWNGLQPPDGRTAGAWRRSYMLCGTSNLWRWQHCTTIGVSRSQQSCTVELLQNLCGSEHAGDE